jgi:hypothetical protein
MDGCDLKFHDFKSPHSIFDLVTKSSLLEQWPRSQAKPSQAAEQEQTTAPTYHEQTEEVEQPRAKKPRGMAAGGGGGLVKHILLARFREEVTPERLEQLIQGYAALVGLVPSMKAFHW